MATTKLADVIVPAIFNPYVTERFSKLSAFWTSGVVQDVSDLKKIQEQKGGSLIEMPFWKPLAASNNVLVDTANITPQKHVTARASAPILSRVEAWERTDLSAALAGSDPLTALGDQVAQVEADAKQNALIASAVGALVAGNANLLDISGLAGAAAVIDADSFLDAEQVLGDAKRQLAAIAMHSATETALRKQNLIVYEKPSESGVAIPYYNGKRVIIDDSLPASGGIYTTFLFAAGAMRYANVPDDALVETETERQALINGGQETLVRRMRYVIHPNGFRWTLAQSSQTNLEAGPTNTELQANNWSKVYDTKNVGIVAFRHKIA